MTCSTASSKRSRRPPTPARSATGRSSSRILNRSCAFAPARPARMRSKRGGIAMKKLLTLLAFAGALGFAAPAVGQAKAATPPAAPAAAPAATPDAKAAEAPKADAGAPAAAAPAPAAPTEPQLVAADKINSGDTAWMLTSTALVLLMTIPGLALFYGGKVGKKNVHATLLQTFAITVLGTVLSVAAGLQRTP